MYFKQDGAISKWNCKLLKLVDQITYLGSNISSTESNVNIYIGKVWTDFSDKIKSKFFQAVAIADENITDAHYADDPAFLANTPTQTKFLLSSLEQAARGIGFSVNSDKTEFMRWSLHHIKWQASEISSHVHIAW